MTLSLTIISGTWSWPWPVSATSAAPWTWERWRYSSRGPQTFRGVENGDTHLSCIIISSLRLNQFEQSKMSATASLGRSGVSKMSQNTELSREFAPHQNTGGGEDTITCFKCNIMTSNYQVTPISSSWHRHQLPISSGVSWRPECRLPWIPSVSATRSQVWNFTFNRLMHKNFQSDPSFTHASWTFLSEF